MSAATTLNALIDQARGHYKHNCANHRLTVLHQDGLYRHLRVAAPGTWMYGHDIITWPRHIAITGDIGGYLWARDVDMLDFMARPLSPDYWQEKLVAPHARHVDRFSEEKYRQAVDDWTHGAIDAYELDDEHALILQQAVATQLRGPDEPRNTPAALEQLSQFQWAPPPGLPPAAETIADPWEWDLTEPDPQYLLCCVAVHYAARRHLHPPIPV